MRLCLLCSVLLLAACTAHDVPPVLAPPPSVPADLLRPAPGYAGPVPQTEGQLSDALIAEARGRRQANRQLAAIAEIVAPE